MSDKRSIYELFAEVKREVGPVGKDSKNTKQNYNYRGIDAVVNATAAALDKHGVITIPILEKLGYSTVEIGERRTPMAHVQVEVTYRFAGPAGDYFDARVPGEAMDVGDKATPKAMSVAYRVALLQCLNLPTSEPDPDSQNYERSPRAASAGDAFENAAPAPPRQNGSERNGQQQRRPQPARPQAAQEVAPAANPEDIDRDAQEYANEAHGAVALPDIEDIHKRAREAGKLTALIRNPASGDTGKTGKLAVYLDWKRKQIKELDEALTQLQAAGDLRDMDTMALGEHVKAVTGTELEAASAAQLRQAAAALAPANGRAA